MERRKFLEMLGLATAGVAFNSAITSPIWELPKDLVITDGPVTSEWIVAESLKALCEDYEFPQRSAYAKATIPVTDINHRGVEVRYAETALQMTRAEFRKRSIEPAMNALANELRAYKPNVFLPMHIPAAISDAKLVTHYQSGLNLRYIRAYDPGGEYEELPGVWKSYPPSIRTRLDLRFA